MRYKPVGKANEVSCFIVEDVVQLEKIHKLNDRHNYLWNTAFSHLLLCTKNHVHIVLLFSLVWRNGSDEFERASFRTLPLVCGIKTTRRTKQIVLQDWIDSRAQPQFYVFLFCYFLVLLSFFYCPQASSGMCPFFPLIIRRFLYNDSSKKLLAVIITS